MSFESNNYVVIIQQALLFSPLMHLFRNHYCLCTRGADAQQELCCLGKSLALGFLLHHPLSDPLGHTYTHGWTRWRSPWSPTESLASSNILCMAKLIWLHRPSSRDCMVLDRGWPWHSFVAATQPTYPCACISCCLPESLFWCLDSRKYKAQEVEAVLTG